jgi:hypothetical protein
MKRPGFEADRFGLFAWIWQRPASGRSRRLDWSLADGISLLSDDGRRLTPPPPTRAAPACSRSTSQRPSHQVSAERQHFRLAQWPADPLR